MHRKPRAFLAALSSLHFCLGVKSLINLRGIYCRVKRTVELARGCCIAKAAALLPWRGEKKFLDAPNATGVYKIPPIQSQPPAPSRPRCARVACAHKTQQHLPCACELLRGIIARLTKCIPFAAGEGFARRRGCSPSFLPSTIRHCLGSFPLGVGGRRRGGQESVCMCVCVASPTWLLL